MSDPAAMQKQIDDLEFENRELREALMPSHAKVPAEWGLTKVETRVLTALAAREELNKAQVMLAIARAAVDIDQYSRDYERVIIHDIRRKLEPLGVHIKTIQGRGYSLDKKWRDKIMGRAA